MIKIEKKMDCSGCHACYNVCPKNAINMLEDEKEFKYPVINKEQCINCNLCEKVCPIINKKHIVNSPKIYVCYNKDEKVREKSSSGGIFTLIAREILQRKGVVFGAAFNKDFSVSHMYIEDIEKLDMLRRSKYVQSSINDTYRQAKEFLEAGRFVLFTGTPCQIEGLLAYLGKQYDKLYTQDIVCHGVPSQKVWRKYLNYRAKIDNERPVGINFRDKKQEGWHRFSLSFKYKNFEYAKNQTNDLFMKAFLRNICLRDSCYECSFRKEHRLSDITLADCWGINNINPSMDDNKGTSLILINSSKGEELYNNILEDIESYETTMEKAIESNPSIIQSPEINLNREKFFYDIDNMEFDKVVNKNIPQVSLLRKCIRKIKTLLKGNK